MNAIDQYVKTSPQTSATNKKENITSIIARSHFEQLLMDINFPFEIWKRFFFYLTKQDNNNCRLVCKVFYSLFLRNPCQELIHSWRNTIDPFPTNWPEKESFTAMSSIVRKCHEFMHKLRNIYNSQIDYTNYCESLINFLKNDRKFHILLDYKKNSKNKPCENAMENVLLKEYWPLLAVLHLNKISLEDRAWLQENIILSLIFNYFPKINDTDVECFGISSEFGNPHFCLLSFVYDINKCYENFLILYRLDGNRACARIAYVMIVELITRAELCKIKKPEHSENIYNTIFQYMEFHSYWNWNRGPLSSCNTRLVEDAYYSEGFLQKEIGKLLHAKGLYFDRLYLKIGAHALLCHNLNEAIYYLHLSLANHERNSQDVYILLSIVYYFEKNYIPCLEKLVAALEPLKKNYANRDQYDLAHLLFHVIQKLQANIPCEYVHLQRLDSLGELDPTEINATLLYHQQPLKPYTIWED